MEIVPEASRLPALQCHRKAHSANTWRIISGLGSVVDNHGDRPVRIGLWDPFQMAFLWLLKGGGPDHLLTSRRMILQVLHSYSLQHLQTLQHLKNTPTFSSQVPFFCPQRYHLSHAKWQAMTQPAVSLSISPSWPKLFRPSQQDAKIMGNPVDFCISGFPIRGYITTLAINGGEDCNPP